MKNIFIALVLSAVTTAHAGDVHVSKISQYLMYGNASATPSFEINKDMGRAWVKITSYQHEESSSERVKIEGLSYDQASKSVVIDHEGKLTTCAEYKTVGKSIFKRTDLFMTKDCKFEAKWRETTYDDGFEIKKSRNYYITLKVK